MARPCFAPPGSSRSAYSNREPSSSGSVLTPNSNARSRGGKEAADAARFEAAEALGLPVKDGRVEYPDAQLEYHDSEGRSGRVNVEIATEHYSVKSIGAKAAAGFAVSAIPEEHKDVSRLWISPSVSPLDLSISTF